MIMDIYGIDRKIKRIIKTKNPPDLGQYNSFNDYLGNKGMDSC